MKVIVLVTVVVMALSQVTGQSCFNRRDKSQLSTIIQETKCFQPQPTLVQLKVPDGFDFVQPSVVKLNQCTGLACSVSHRCLPEPGSITKHVYKVLAKKTDGAEPYCAKVEVEEHDACECRCDTLNCDRGMVFDKATCKCKCDPNQEKTCGSRINKGEQVMWSQEKCICQCNLEEKKCNSDAIWDQSVCRCESLDQANSLDSVL